MDKVFFIQYNNGKEYEDYDTWSGEVFFESLEDAENFLVDERYQQTTFEDDLWWILDEVKEIAYAKIVQLVKYEEGS